MAPTLMATTYNLERGGIDRRDGSTRRLDTALELMAAELADSQVLCIQEANWTPEQLDKVAAALGTDQYVLAHHEHRGTRGTHLATFVREPLSLADGVEAMPHWLWDGPAGCPALLTPVLIPGWPQPVTVANTHLWPWGVYGRLVQAEAITALADRGWLALLGDFNACSPGDPAADLSRITRAQQVQQCRRPLSRYPRRVDTEVMELIHAAGFADAVDDLDDPAARAVPTSGFWDNPPYNGAMLGRKDKLLLSPGLAAHADVVGYRVHGGEAWIALSDHVPVSVELRLATAAAYAREAHAGEEATDGA